MEIRFEGKLIQKLPLQSGTSERGEWKRQNFILEYQDNGYTRKVCISAWTNSVQILEGFNEGDMMSVAVSVESRESARTPGQWFTDVRAYRIERPGQGMPYGQPMQQQYQQPMQQQYQQQYQQPMQQPYQQQYQQPMQQQYQQPFQQPQQPAFPEPAPQPAANPQPTGDDLPF